MPSDVGLINDERLIGSTKTDKPRKFPCNSKLQRFLKAIKLENAQAEDSVFPYATGKYLDSHNITNRVWKAIVQGLVAKNLVAEYLPLYHTRHTFITLVLDAGMTTQDVARIVGNTPKVISDNYVTRRKDRNLQIPEF